jgi:serine/threonine protein kinase
MALDSDIVAAFPDLAITLPMLGQGGFKLAFRGMRNGLPVVLKVIKAPLGGPEMSVPERLRRELEAMQRIDSPNVVPLIGGPDVRRLGRYFHLWYLEPYYAGGTLEDELRGVALPWARVLDIATGLIVGISALWDQGHLVHRDIKPANIAIDECNRPVLLDLGIALHTDLPGITDPFGSSPRTLAFAAPEQLLPPRLAETNFRTDLFLVGITAYLSLIGTHPFYPFTPESDYIARLARGEFNRPALAGGAAPEKLKEFIARCLSARPNQRFRTLLSARSALAEVGQ